MNLDPTAIYWRGWEVWTAIVLGAITLLLTPIYVLLYLIWRK